MIPDIAYWIWAMLLAAFAGFDLYALVGKW